MRSKFVIIIVLMMFFNLFSGAILTDVIAENEEAETTQVEEESSVLVTEKEPEVVDETAQPEEITEEEIIDEQEIINNQALNEQDWLHYSIDLVWDIADQNQKYNQKVVTAASAVLQPKYRLTVQTSSVIYEAGSMEIRLPLTMYTKRTTSHTQNGESKVYDPAVVNPKDISVPTYPNQSDVSSFAYRIDEDKNELVFINTKEIPAGNVETIEVMYEINPRVIVDLDTATFQAKAKATPKAEEAGEYEEEKRESPTITYQLDVGLESITGVASRTKGTGFEPLKIEDGYRYYEAYVTYRTEGNSPYYLNLDFNFDNENAEILGPVENYNSKTPMTIEEAKAYYSTVSYINDGGSNPEGDTYEEVKGGFKIYLRYPDTDEIEKDSFYVTCNAVAFDDDSHQEPEDMNDRLSTSTTYSYTWPKYPDKPRGIWYKNPIGQNRDRVEFLEYIPQYLTSSTDSYHGAARFYVGVEDDHVIYSGSGDGNTLVITDTGLEQERVIDTSGTTEPSGAPYLEYEISGVYLPILKTGSLRIFNEDTKSIDEYEGEWFENIVIEGSKDGNSWEEVYTIDGDNYHDPKMISQFNVSWYNEEIAALWVGKGYRQSRITFNGVKQNIVIGGDIACIYMHGTDDSKEFLMRQELDQYTNWANIELYDVNHVMEYDVKDWGMMTLMPLTEYGYSQVYKNTWEIINNPANQEVYVDFRINGFYRYSLINSNMGDTSDIEEIGRIGFELRKKHPDLFEGLKHFDDLETIVSYDLLPEGYSFVKIVGNDDDSYESGRAMAEINNAKNRITPSVEVIDNYKGTKRQMVIFTWDLKNAINSSALSKEISVGDLELNMKYRTKIAWEDLVFYQNEHNLYAQQRGDAKEIFNGRKDDGEPTSSPSYNLSVFKEVKDREGNYAFRDVNGDGDTETANTLYSYSTVSPNVAMSATTGITKQIMGDSNKWTDLDSTDINKEYYYRVRVTNGESTHIKDLVIFDTLEEAANTQLEQNEVTWKGSFKSIDVSQMERFGFAPVVYYSTADPSELDYNNVTGREDNIWIDDTSIWSTTLPDDPSKVTAVAVDVRKMQDGSDAELTRNQGVEFIITMTAPPEYPTLKDPAMVYAINRPAYHCFQYVDYAADGTYFTQIGRRVKIYLGPKGSLTVKKVFENQQTNATFTITGPNGFTDTFTYEDMVDGVYVIENLQMGTYTVSERFGDYMHAYTVNFDGAANITDSSSYYTKNVSGDVTLEYNTANPKEEDYVKEVVITNTSKFTDIQGTKKWQEREDITEAKYGTETDEEGIVEFPDTRFDYTVFAVSNGKIYGRTDEYLEAEAWDIRNLPIKDEEGNDLTYTLEEYMRLHYSFYYQNRDYETETSTIGIFGKDPFNYADEVELKLLAYTYNWQTDEETFEFVETKTLNVSEITGETIVWENLPLYNNSGARIDYLIFVEVESLGYQMIEEEGNITNTRLMDVTATKVWDAPAGDKTPEITLVLNKTVNGETSEIEGSEKTIPANATGEDLKVVWENLPEYEEGSPVTYTVSEKEGQGFENVEITGNDIEGFVVSNRILTDIEGEKVWDDNDNQDRIRPETITVLLLEDGNEIDRQEVSEETEWKYSFTNLPKYKEGKEIEYTVDEVDVEGYTKVIDGITITNTHIPETTEISINKIWEDENDKDGLRPETITVKLMADGAEIQSYEVSEADGWTYTFTGLPKYKEGKEIEYTVDEVDVEGYTKVVDGTTITNTHIPETTEISINKIWEDENDKDGLRPETISVKLMADGEEIQSQEVSEVDGWTYTFTGLPKYKEGKEIEYTVDEVDVEGYTKVIDGTTITNTHIPLEPELTEVVVTKVWDDTNNVSNRRPSSITVNLLADGEKVDSKELTADNNWKYTFTNLQKEKDGKEIVYTVSEEPVDYYVAVIDGLTIKNVSRPWFPVTPGEPFGSLVIKKTVSGEAEKDKEYTFLVEITTDEDVYTETIKLKANEEKRYDLVEVGSIVTVKELNTEGYTVKAYVDGVTINNGESVQIVKKDNTTITINNDKTTPKKEVPDTSDGSNLNIYTFTLMFSIMISAISVIFKRKYS